MALPLTVIQEPFAISGKSTVARPVAATHDTTRQSGPTDGIYEVESEDSASVTVTSQHLHTDEMAGQESSLSPLQQQVGDASPLI